MTPISLAIIPEPQEGLKIQEEGVFYSLPLPDMNISNIPAKSLGLREGTPCPRFRRLWIHKRFGYQEAFFVSINGSFCIILFFSLSYQLLVFTICQTSCILEARYTLLEYAGFDTITIRIELRFKDKMIGCFSMAFAITYAFSMLVLLS